MRGNALVRFLEGEGRAISLTYSPSSTVHLLPLLSLAQKKKMDVRFLIGEKLKKMKVYFSHGKESGPWGTKIKKLATIAKEHGCSVESIDYTDIENPDLRVRHLLD